MGFVTKDLQRVWKYKPFENVLNISGIQFPVKLQDITKFGQQNPTVSFNVYIFDHHEERVRTFRLMKVVKQHHIHLLMLTKPPRIDDDNYMQETIKSHS